MALRLQCGFYSEEAGTSYTISIYDEEYVGSTIDFLPDAEGFVITWQGANDKMKPPILTSKCSISIYIDSTDIETFIDDLNTAYEGQIRVKVTTGSSGVWYGHVLYDSIQIEDAPTTDLPIFKLVATDGVKRLKSIPYKDTSGPYTGEESITQHLINCISEIGLTDLMTEESGVLKSVSNWWPSNRISGDDMDHTYFDHQALLQKDNKGNIKYPSVYTVIEQLCYVFHCKFMMADGWYWFIQHNEYENNTISPDEYTAAKAALGSTVVNSYISVDSTFTGKFGRNYFSYFPPLNIAQVDYIHFGYSNFARGYVWDEATQPTIPESPTVYEVAANTSFFFFGSIRFTLTYSGDRPYYLKFLFSLNVDTNQYLKRPANARNPIYYGEQSIESTADNYEMVFPIELADGYSYGEGRENITFTSIEFPNAGEFSFTIAFDNAYDQQGNTVAGVSLFWEISGTELTALNDGDTSNITNTKRVTAYNATTGNSIKEVVNKVIGEALGYGKLRNDTTPSGKVVSADWGVGASVSSQSIEELLAIEMIRTQSVPIKKATMNFLSSTYNPTLSIHHGSNTWIFQRGRWRARYEIFEGDWYLLDTTGTTSGNTSEDWTIYEIDEGNDVTPTNPLGGGVTSPTGDTSGDDDGTGVPSVIDALFPRTTADLTVSGGAITQIPIEARGADGEYKVGQTITVIDPVTGAQQDWVITQESQTSDTVLYVQSDTPDFDFRTGSWIVTSQEQTLSAGGSTAFYREEFAAHASATITVTENSGNLPTNAAAIRVYFDNGQLISKNYWSHSGSDITLTYTPNGAQSIWVEFNV